jgi:hypothetical protein
MSGYKRAYEMKGVMKSRMASFLPPDLIPSIAFLTQGGKACRLSGPEFILTPP